MSENGDREQSRERSRRDRERGRDRNNRRSSRDRSVDRGRGAKSSQNRVYVSNIPYEYRWQDLKDLFRNEVGDVAFVELFVDDNDKSKGCGIVEFTDPSSVEKSMKVMQRFEVKNRKLVVKEDSGNARDKHGNVLRGGRSRNDDSSRYRDDRDHHNQGSVSQDDGKWGNTYGLSPEFLASLQIDGPLMNRVFVANLEYNVDKKKLKEVFRLAGRVVKVDLPLDKEGRSRGFAVVEYDHPVEAVQAISMLHNQVLFDRTLAVRMDRADERLKLPEGLKNIGMGLGPNGEPLKNVALNLPNNNNNQQPQPSAAPNGLMNTVPNNALQVASALTGLNVSSLSGLNASVLGAANLGGLASNLLSNGLGGGADLSSLVAQANHPLLAAQQQQLSALTGGNAGLGANSLSSNIVPPASAGNPNSVNQSAFGRGPSEAFVNQPVSYPQTYSSSSARSAATYQAPASNDLRNNYNTGSMGGLKSSSLTAGGGDSKVYSRKVLISNLPPTASFKLLQEKLNEFGEVSYWEEKGAGSFLVVYGSDWQAERAIKNLDKARIDGRYIDARSYF